MGWMVNATPRPLYPLERHPVPIVQESEWTPGPVWKGARSLASPSEFDPRTIQPLASRCIDYGIPAHKWAVVCLFTYVLVRRHFSQLLLEYLSRYRDKAVLV